MPNPKTIEELLKMKPCPFEDGEWIDLYKIEDYIKRGILSAEIYYCRTNGHHNSFNGSHWLMPKGYYYLPPDKQLGLPLGEWTLEDLQPLMDVLPFGVLKRYLARTEIAVNYYGGSLEPSDLTNYKRMINLRKQPPNLYNPLDHKEEVLMENNSANEELRYQLKCPPKFTPFNPNFFERKFTLDELKALNFQPASCGIMPMSKIDEITNYIGVCFSDQTWGLSEEGITYLNDQITQIIHDHHQPEAEPVKEQPTPTELPWQDISTLKESGWKGYVTVQHIDGKITTCLEEYINAPQYLTHWLPITPPKALTVEAPPVEPERVSYSWFAIEPEGTWYCLDYESGYQLFTHLTTYEATSNLIREVIANGYPIYATEPSAWLAWKAEQEGKSV